MSTGFGLKVTNVVVYSPFREHRLKGQAVLLIFGF
jgi:hypothetical protein